MAKKQPETKKKGFWAKLWHFIWNEDSALSWLINIVLAVVLIKFVIYPVLGLVLGTGYPIVAVVSESMVHKEGFDTWWSANKPYYLNKGITQNQFETFYFTNGFNKGDVMVLTKASQDNVKIGDIVVIKSGKPYPVIHRVIAIHDTYFETKGDNNIDQIVDYQLNEKRIPYDALVGKAVGRLPVVGYIKIAFVEFVKLFGLHVA